MHIVHVDATADAVAARGWLSYIIMSAGPEKPENDATLTHLFFFNCTEQRPLAIQSGSHIYIKRHSSIV